MEVLIHRSSTMATIVKPKERQFQVVPVPAIFTRGRWECRDFKESANYGTSINAGGNTNNENIQIFEFQSQSQHLQSDVPSTMPLMRNDVKNIVATNIVLPDILPNNTDASVSSIKDNSNVSSGFISQTTVVESESNKDGIMSSGAVTTNNTNAVAIDNKIEQAMDLVKTHLTFAVREEVEQLRAQISDLESRVNSLETENQILRQFTPAEVIANLPFLLQQQKTQATPTNTNVETIGVSQMAQSQSIQMLQQQTSQPQIYPITTATASQQLNSVSSVSSAPVLVNMTNGNPSVINVNQQQPSTTINQAHGLPNTRSPTPVTNVGHVTIQNENATTTQHLHHK